MKHVKSLGLMVAVTTALMTFTGIASATVVTSPAGTTYTGTIKAENENGEVSIHGANGVTVECAAKLEGNIQSHGVATTATWVINSVSFPNCTNGNIIHVTIRGHIGFHSMGGGNASFASKSQKTEITAATIFGTITCIYETNETSIGTLTGGTPATLDISGTIPRTGGSALCGSSGTLTGSYKITSPGSLFVD